MSSRPNHSILTSAGAPTASGCGDFTGGSPTYALGHSQRELKRLTTQAALFEPFTRRMFEQAGLAQGMRVLDVGSGNGDVALLAASFVGESGEILGIDRAPAAVEAANARAQAAGLRNVAFVTADPIALCFDRPFDAVVGRLFLMYQPDAVAMLRHLVRQLKRGGIVAFHEFDIRGAQCFPESGLFAKAKNWVEAALVRIGADGRMGLKLYSSFIAAGLPAPSMSMDASTGGGAQSPGSVLLPEVIRSLLPVIERFGIATAEEVEIESLELRLRAEIAKLNAVTILPPLIGAWTKTPAWNNRCWISTP